jgi:glycosyltransferase involved in cell wall biosynthesis
MFEKQISIDVILAAYNEPEFTSVTLEAYSRQTDRNFKILLADDGSKDPIRQLILSYQKKLNIEHFFQEDKGFRKAKILNRAAYSSNADYLVFSDNDCVPSKYFIEDHKMAAEPGRFVSGRRIDGQSNAINQTFLQPLGDKDMPFERMSWLIWHSLMKNIKYAEVAFRVPYWLHLLWSKREKPLLGANFGIWRSDFIKVGGFDETFTNYGGEEVDLEKRLLEQGIAKRKSLLGRGYIFHFYHASRADNKRR